jgi:hypothetical protein
MEEGFEDNYSAVWTWRNQSDFTDEGLDRGREDHMVCRSVPTHALCVTTTPERMNRLRRRRWRPDNNKGAESDTPFIDVSAAEFDVHRFLSSIAGKKVGFVGDSVMVQIFSSFVCFLTQYTTSKIIYDYGWTYGVTFIRDDRCPGSGSCDLLGGSAFFTESNTTFFIERVSRHFWGL